MKKVLIIQQIIPHYRIDFFNLLRAELAKKNIELNLIYGNSSTTYKSGAEYNVLEWGKVVENKIISIGDTQLAWQPLVKYVKEQDLVIVEKSNKLLLNYYLIIARKVGKFKLGFWGHGRNLQSKPDSWSNKFGLITLKKCDWWFAYTNSVKEYLMSKNFPANKISVIENAIDTKSLQERYIEISDDEIHSIKIQLGIQGENVAIFCGGMYANKRMDFILETCYRIKKAIPDFHMIFVGTGEEAYKIENAASDNDWMHYVGAKKGLDRVIYFKISAIQLMPGLVGLGVLDSFALQTPIITTNYEYHSPEVGYLVDGQNGIITDNDIEKYSEVVIDILKTNQFENLVKGCIDAAGRYTLERMVQNVKDGIESCLRQPKKFLSISEKTKNHDG